MAEPVDFASPSASDSAPAERLEHLLRANACSPYHDDLPDKENPAVTCSIYGAPETNKLFVKLSNGSVTQIKNGKGTSGFRDSSDSSSTPSLGSLAIPGDD